MLVLQLSTLVMWDVAGAWFEINASQVAQLNFSVSLVLNFF
jgi:hypothetical protein